MSRADTEAKKTKASFPHEYEFGTKNVQLRTKHDKQRAKQFKVEHSREEAKARLKGFKEETAAQRAEYNSIVNRFRRGLDNNIGRPLYNYLKR